VREAPHARIDAERMFALRSRRRDSIAGLRIVQQSTLMGIGLYNEPAGAYLPSILF